MHLLASIAFASASLSADEFPLSVDASAAARDPKQEMAEVSRDLVVQLGL
jgi:hypothetical protein